MLVVQKARDIEVRAHILNDDIRRVTPAAHRDITVGQGEPFNRLRIGTANDLEAGSSGMRERKDVESIGTLQIRAELVCDLLLSLRGAIRKLRTKRRSGPGVDTQRRCAFRR